VTPFVPGKDKKAYYSRAAHSCVAYPSCKQPSSHTYNHNKKQSETADVAWVAPPGELDEKYASSLRFCPFNLLCENMTSSTKPEVNNVLHHRQKRTESRPQVTCTENLLKFGGLFSEIRERTDKKQTDRQTDRHSDTLITIYKVISRSS